MTHAAVRDNMQLALDLATGQTLEPDPVTGVRRVTWWLLICTRHDEVRLELSLPRAIGEDGRIGSWAERIILEPLGGEPTLVETPDDPDLPPIDVPVERR